MEYQAYRERYSNTFYTQIIIYFMCASLDQPENEACYCLIIRNFVTRCGYFSYSAVSVIVIMLALYNAK